MTQVDNNSSSMVPFDRVQLNKVFKVVIFDESTYTGNAYTSPRTEIAHELLEPFPSGRDFHSVDSPEIDLSAYEGKVIRIAFEYDMNMDTYGKHYLTWEIFKFDLYGVGQLNEVAPAAISANPVSPNKPVSTTDFTWEQRFKKGLLEPFKNYVKVANSAPWISADRAGTSIARVASVTDPSDSWLISPSYDLVSVSEMSISVNQTASPATGQQLHLWVSSDFTGGDPEKAKWDELTLGKDAIDLKAYVGKKVVFAFEFIDPGGTQNSWEIQSLTLRGKGDRPRFTPLTVTPKVFSNAP
jgi:hypothetical protein